MRNNFFNNMQGDEADSMAQPLDIPLPIQLEQATGSKIWTWSYHGQQMRRHFYSGYWFSEDGKHAFWGWLDWESHTLTKLKPVTILIDTSNRPYVQVKSKGKLPYNLYVEDAVCICFHGWAQPGQFADHLDGDPRNCAADNLKWICL